MTFYIIFTISQSNIRNTINLSQSKTVVPNALLEWLGNPQLKDNVPHSVLIT